MYLSFVLGKYDYPFTNYELTDNSTNGVINFRELSVSATRTVG